MKNIKQICAALLLNLVAMNCFALSLETTDGAQRLFDFGLKLEQPFIVVNYDENKLYYMKYDDSKNLIVIKDYVVSNGRGGLSNVIKSGGTPPGVHRIWRKQGHDFAVGQSFDAGQKAGLSEQIMKPTLGYELWPSDFVLTRILRIEGLEGSLNNNSTKRSILIHGTGPEGILGYHESLGCIRMSNLEVIDLFNRIPEPIDSGKKNGVLVNIVSKTKEGLRRRVPDNLVKILSKEDERRYLKETSTPISKRGPSSTNDGEVSLLAGGDILFHGSLMMQAMGDGLGFESFFADVKPLMKQADVMYANLEGPVAYQVNVYGQLDITKGTNFVPTENIYSSMDETFLSFNFHPKAVPALTNVGINVVSTANNHTFDRKFVGIDKTLEELQKSSLSFYGTKHSTNLAAPWTTVKTVNGIRFGFVGCTYGIQGAGAKDSEQAFKQVMFCFSGNGANPALIKEIAQLAPKVDVVVFTPHWGTEYAAQANDLQKKTAAAAIEAGARIILGSHPHVLQPFEVVKSGAEIKAIIAYSLGNFVTNQMSTDWRDPKKQTAQFPTRVAALMGMKIKKVENKVTLSLPLWIPTYMAPKSATGLKGRKLLLAYPELHGPNLKGSILSSRKMTEERLGPDAQILNLDQTTNIFSNIKW